MSDDSIIDEKKNQNAQTTSSDYASKLKEFGKSFAIVFVVVLAYFSFSGMALMLCKVAQSNVLPTDLKSSPYTDIDPQIDPIQMNIFTTGPFTEPELSMKLEIPYKGSNKTYRILEAMRDYKMDPNSNFLVNYIIEIIESLVQFNFSTINNIMNLMNGLPEVLIVMVGPLINCFLFGVAMVLNFFYFIYLYFANLKWFFKENLNTVNSRQPPKWADVTLFSPISWGIGVALVILFVIIFIVALPLLSFLPFVIVCYCMLSSILFKVKLNGGRDASLFTIIAGVLLHYKLTIVTILSVAIVSLAFTDLGTAQGVMAIVTACCIYYGLIHFNTFTPIKESNMTAAVSNDQAKKVKMVRLSNQPDPEVEYFGGGGKQFVKRLRKIGDTLRKCQN